MHGFICTCVPLGCATIFLGSTWDDWFMELQGWGIKKAAVMWLP